MAVGAVIGWVAVSMLVFDVLDQRGNVQRYIAWYRDRYGKVPEDLPMNWEIPKWYERRPYISEKERLAWWVFDEIVEEAAREIAVAYGVGRLFTWAGEAITRFSREVIAEIFGKGGVTSEEAKIIANYLKQNPHLNVSGRYIVDPITGRIVYELRRDTGMSFSFGNLIDQFRYGLSQPVEWAIEWQVAVIQWNFLRKFRDRIAQYKPALWGWLTFNNIYDMLETLRWLVESGWYEETVFPRMDRTLWVDRDKAPDDVQIEITPTTNGLLVRNCRTKVDWEKIEYCGDASDPSGVQGRFSYDGGAGYSVDEERTVASYSVATPCRQFWARVGVGSPKDDRPSYFLKILNENLVEVESDKFSYNTKTGKTKARFDAYFFCALPTDTARFASIAQRLNVPVTWTQTATGWQGRFFYAEELDQPPLWYRLEVEGKIFQNDTEFWNGISHCGGFIALDPIYRNRSEVRVTINFVVNPDSKLRIYLPVRWRKVRLRGKEGEMCVAVVPPTRYRANDINPDKYKRRKIDYYRSRVYDYSSSMVHSVEAIARLADAPKPIRVVALEAGSMFETEYLLQRVRDGTGNISYTRILVRTNFHRYFVDANYAEDPNTRILTGSTNGFDYEAVSTVDIYVSYDSARPKKNIKIKLSETCPREGTPWRPRIVCSFQ